MIYLTTDTHFNHKNIIKYCNRPENFEEMIWKGLENLPTDCTLIHLGDICFGKNKEIHQRISKLPYCKILIRGNHDEKSDDWYLDNGWDAVDVRLDTHFKGKFITFSHRPIKGIQNLNIHGHQHNRKDGQIVVENREERIEIERTSNHKLLAIEYTGYQPMLLEEFLKN